MKLMKRKLLSLLLAMAMILTLAPTALAAGEVSISGDSEVTYGGDAITLTAQPAEGLTVTNYKWTVPDALSTNSILDGADASSISVSAANDADSTGNEVSVEITYTSETVTTPATASATKSIAVKAQEQDPVATGMTITPSPVTLTLGGKDDRATLSAKVTGTGNPSQKVNYKVTSSSPDGVIVMSDNVVIAVKAGDAVITATSEAVDANGDPLTQTINVKVNAAVEKPEVELKLSTDNIYYSSSTTAGANNTATMTMKITGDYAGYALSWSITNEVALAAKPSNTIAESYTLTAADVKNPTAVKIKAVLTKKDSETITSNEVTLTVNPSEVFTLTPSPSNTTSINWNNLTLDGGYYPFSVTASWVSNGKKVELNEKTVSYRWELNNQTLNITSNGVRLSSSSLAYSQNNYLTCYVTFKRADDGTTAKVLQADWTINMGYSSSVLATATVSTSTSSYALGDLDDAGKSSIVDQLESYFSSTARGSYGLAYVTFSNIRDGSNGSLSANTNTTYYADRQGSGTNPRYLSDVLFYPGTSKTTATFQGTFYYYNTRSQSLRDVSSVTGSITFSVVESASTGDITYNASIGDDVTFAVKDFEDFYYSKTRGNLSYVTFTLPSGGTLYADGGRLNTSNACYAAPGRTQTDLAGVYFSPSGTTATRAGTVRISFTAYGTRSSTSGTVAITYLSGTAKDIVYNITTSGTLKASDFTDAYREVVGSAAPTGLTIEFQNVPTYGGLTYKDSSRTNATLVTLRDSNIKTYKFTTRTTGSNQLGDVTYTANGLHTDTIDYIAYVNNTPQFTGKVVFNSTNVSATNMQVSYTSTNGQAVTFSYADFAKANAAVIASTSYIRFVTLPTGGTLTYGGVTVTLSSTNVPPASLGSVVYRPNAGYNNSTDRISFLCYDANGNSVGGGQVSIVVTGNASNTAAVATVNSFKDVSATAWYRDDLITLVGAGIIQGRGDGKFDPTAELTYGEALKIFMLASGYPKLAETSGKDWAINYKNLAVSNGWISSTVDLSAKISRNAMAELVAKSLGVAASSVVPPTWKDGTSNSYANALYYTNPQILIGNADGTFMGTSTLKRQEICAIACRVMNYKSNQQTVDTGKPSWLG